MKTPLLVAVLTLSTLLTACGDNKPQATMTKTVLPVDPCDNETDLVSRAKFLATGNPQNAVDILQPCSNKLTSEGQKFLEQITAEAETHKAKALATEKAREVKNQKMLADAQKRIQAQRKREGVSIGMTQEEVLGSSWGRPQSVNRTTGTYGTHEQWVYGGRNYLYFQNGILTTIQN